MEKTNKQTKTKQQNKIKKKQNKNKTQQNKTKQNKNPFAVLEIVLIY